MFVTSANQVAKPICFKGHFANGEMCGDGIISFTSGLTLFAQFKDGLIKDSYM